MSAHTSIVFVSHTIATHGGMDFFDLALLFFGGLAAGTFGALFGLGGGIIMVPLLVIALKVPMHNAVATSLVGVIATSTASTIRNLGDRLPNLRLGVTLETATVAGAITGGLIAGFLPARALMVLFGITLIAVAFVMSRQGEPPPLLEEPSDQGFLASLHGSYYDTALAREVRYGMRRLPVALSTSGIAGVLSGLLGIGGGIIKVPTLAIYCGVPMKVATATSNFMMGVTAVASVFAYFGRGEVLPLVTAAAVLGIIGGARLGTWLSTRTHPLALRKWFALVMLLMGGQMIWKVFH